MEGVVREGERRRERAVFPWTDQVRPERSHFSTFPFGSAAGGFVIHNVAAVATKNDSRRRWRCQKSFTSALQEKLHVFSFFTPVRERGKFRALRNFAK